MNFDTRISALRDCRLFESVPAGDIATLAETMREETYSKDAFVCREGEAADRVFVVLSGNLEVHVPGSHEAPTRLERGELFGEYGLFAEGFRTASVVSTSDSVLLTLDYTRFRSFLVMFPETMFAILEATVRRLQHAQHQAARSAR